MPLRDSEAIVLRTFPLAEADRLVSLLTRDFGRLRGVAQGARRPKSRYGASLEPLTHLRVWFYEKETRELVRIGQCEIIESFLDVQQDYRSGLAISLAAEITEAVLPEREPQDHAFRLLLHVSRGFRDLKSRPLALGYFLVWTLRLAGWLPDLDAKPGPRTPVIPPKVAVAARILLTGTLEKIAASEKSPSIAPDFEAYFLDMIEQQIDKRLQARRMYEETR
jgi:DNA repair protein RecO (recombination protein O)